MKKIFLIFAMALSMFTMDSNAQKLEKLPEAYLYAMGTSLTDSVAYVSEVIALDNAWYTKSNGFLYSREEYSLQFRKYLEGLGISHPMTVAMFELKREKAEKKLLKMQKKLKKSGYLIKYVPRTEFKFTAIPYEEESTTENSQTAEEKQ